MKCDINLKCLSFVQLIKFWHSSDPIYESTAYKSCAIRIIDIRISLSIVFQHILCKFCAQIFDLYLILIMNDTKSTLLILFNLFLNFLNCFGTFTRDAICLRCWFRYIFTLVPIPKSSMLISKVILKQFLRKQLSFVNKCYDLSDNTSLRLSWVRIIEWSITIEFHKLAFWIVLEV